MTFRSMQLVIDGRSWFSLGCTGGEGSTKDHTLVRKPVVVGTVKLDASAGTNLDDTEWLIFPQNMNDLGVQDIYWQLWICS